MKRSEGSDGEDNEYDDDDNDESRRKRSKISAEYDPQQIVNISNERYNIGDNVNPTNPDAVVILWKKLTENRFPRDIYLHHGHPVNPVNYLNYRSLSITSKQFNITDDAIVSSGISGQIDGKTTLQIPLIDFNVAQARDMIDKVLNDEPSERLAKPCLVIGESLTYFQCIIHEMYVHT
jgi:hypothetical protein